jgi:acyl-CoA thioester hydrolase
MKLFETQLTLRWRDLDAYLHVNNANYLTLFEETRILWFNTFPGPWRSPDAEPVVARVEIDYKRALHYPETLCSQLHLERVGNASLSLLHTLSSASDSKIVYATGKTVSVWTDPRVGKSTPLPALVRAACTFIEPSDQNS